ncbi:MAG: c-type cytochrome [Gammaproteobacteria bacterium]
MCHGDSGEGREARGGQVFPPLLGPRSFNWGAGMECISTAAAFIKANMPYGAGNTLTDQQAGMWRPSWSATRARTQAPRFTGSVSETRSKYHSRDSYYGRVINGQLLGAPPRSISQPQSPH